MFESSMGFNWFNLNQFTTLALLIPGNNLMTACAINFLCSQQMFITLVLPFLLFTIIIVKCYFQYLIYDVNVLRDFPQSIFMIQMENREKTI